MNNDHPSQLDRYPYMSYVTHGGEGYLGIVQNYTNTVVCIYHFDSLHSKDEKKLFLELGDEWWWQSNRRVPINIFIKEWGQFRYTLKTFNSKDTVLEFGPYISLKEIAQKRSKRKSITLIRRVDQ